MDCLDLGFLIHKFNQIFSLAGDISVSGDTVTDLDYEFADTEFAWNKDRDLRGREPFFSSGEYFEEDQAALKGAFEQGFEMMLSNLGEHGHDDAEVQKQHKHGVQSLYFILSAMDSR